MNPLTNILRNSLTKYQHNFLISPFDGRFEQLLSLTGHNFYTLPLPAKFDNKIQTGFKRIEDINNIPLEIELDAIICNDRFTQTYDICKQISNNMHIPLLIINHFNPETMMPPENIEKLNQFQSADVSISTSKSIKKYWPNDEIIHYGIDTAKYSSIDKELDTVLLVNNFQSQEMHIVNKIIEKVKKHMLLNTNNNLSEQQMINTFGNAAIYINLVAYNNIPFPLLEAMAAGCAIVSNDVPVIHDILQDSKNAFICKSTDDFQKAIQTLIDNPPMQQTYGRRAQQIIRDNYNIETVLPLWQQLLDNCGNLIYKR